MGGFVEFMIESNFQPVRTLGLPLANEPALLYQFDISCCGMLVCFKIMVSSNIGLEGLPGQSLCQIETQRFDHFKGIS